MKRLIAILLLVLVPSTASRSAIGLDWRPQRDPAPAPVVLPERPVEGLADRGRVMATHLNRLPAELGMYFQPGFDFVLMFPVLPGREVDVHGVPGLLLASLGHDALFVADPDGPEEPGAGPLLPFGAGAFAYITGGSAGAAQVQLASAPRGSVLTPTRGARPHRGGAGAGSSPFGGLPLSSGGFGGNGSGGSGTTGGTGTGAGGNGTGSTGGTTPEVVPLPLPGLMLLTGLGAFAALRRRRAA